MEGSGNGGLKKGYNFIEDSEEEEEEEEEEEDE